MGLIDSVQRNFTTLSVCAIWKEVDLKDAIRLLANRLTAIVPLRDRGGGHCPAKARARTFALYRRCLILVPLLFIAACSAHLVTEGSIKRGGHLGVLPPAFDTSDAAEKYRRLCREKAGPHVYDTTEGVEGVYVDSPTGGCFLCTSGLLASPDFPPYRFVETEFDASMRRRHLAALYVSAPGLYRYTLEAGDDPRCGPFYKARRTPGPKFGGKCVVATPIREVTAKHKLYKYSLRRHRKYPEINESYYGLRNIDDTKIYAEHFSFRFIPDYVGRRIGSGLPLYYACPARNSPKVQRPSLRGTLRALETAEKR